MNQTDGGNHVPPVHVPPVRQHSARQMPSWGLASCQQKSCGKTKSRETPAEAKDQDLGRRKGTAFHMLIAKSGISITQNLLVLPAERATAF